MLVPTFLTAAVLTHAVGNQTNYAHTALLLITPNAVTTAVVDTTDGSIVYVQRRVLPEYNDSAVAELATMVFGAEELETCLDTMLVVVS